MIAGVEKCQPRVLASPVCPRQAPNLATPALNAGGGRLAGSDAVASVETWGSVVEEAAPKLNQISSSVPVSKAVPIGMVDAALATRARTGVAELDRVLGDGLVPGVVVLLRWGARRGKVHTAA